MEAGNIIPPAASSEPKKGNPSATLSVVLALLGCIPFLSIAAIAFGVIGLRKTKNPRVGRKGTAIAGIVLGCLGSLTILPEEIYVLREAMQTANRGKSSNNLRQIGQALLAYSNDNMGRYPPDLGTLVRTENVSVANFLSPSMPGGASPPSNLDQMTRDQQAQWVNQYSDFIYLGSGLTVGEPPETIVLYQKHVQRNSPPDGSFDSYEVQMLFLDGHVEFPTPDEAHRQIESQTSNDLLEGN